jgi:RNA polymerase sigma factor (sigma-70 family)
MTLDRQSNGRRQHKKNGEETDKPPPVDSTTRPPYQRIRLVALDYFGDSEGLYSPSAEEEYLKDEEAKTAERRRARQRTLARLFLEHLVKRLEPREANVLALRFTDTYTYEEIASILGVSRGTVANDIKQIRRVAAELAAEHPKLWRWLR